MTTPIENLVANVNAQTQRDTLQSIGAQQSARRQVADKSSAINAICDNADGQACTNFFNGLAGDGAAEDLLTGDNALIDKVSQRPEAVVGLNTAESAIRKCLCRREGLDPATFADLNAVASDQGLMQSISARQESSKILARSQKASAAAAASQTAMQELAVSLTAMQEVTASQTAMQEVVASQTAMQEMAASQTAMDEVGNSDTARDEVYASETALSEIRPVDQAIAKLSAGEVGQDASLFPDMDTLAADATAMGGVTGSQKVIQEIAASQPAMQGIAASQTAMQEIAASQTAIDEIGSNANESVSANTVLNSSIAEQEFQNSPHERGFSRNFRNAANNGAGTLTNSRVLVTSNNTNGAKGTSISFSVDEGGATFIINSANSNNGNRSDGGSIGFTGIIVN